MVSNLLGSLSSGQPIMTSEKRMNALDTAADKLRRKYCAYHQIDSYPLWWDIKNSRTRTFWRNKVRAKR